PMAVHRQMPVVTAVKCRREFARRRHVGVAVEQVADLVWIFLRDTAEGEIGETLRGLRVESRGRFLSHNDQRKEHQARADEALHYRQCSAISPGSSRKIIDGAPRLLHEGGWCFPEFPAAPSFSFPPA